MSLAPDRPSRKFRQKADAFVSPERETERRPFEGFIERELTEERIKGMLDVLQEMREKKNGRVFSLLANALSVIIPDRLTPEMFDDIIFFGIKQRVVESSLDQARGLNLRLVTGLVRSLETFFPDRRPDYNAVIDSQVPDILRYEKQDLNEIQGDWKNFYDSLFLLRLLAPEKEFTDPFNEGINEGILEHCRATIRLGHSRDAKEALTYMAGLVILHPEVKKELSIDREAEGHVSEYLRQLAETGDYTNMAQAFEKIVLISADRVEIPSRGRLVLHHSPGAISPRQALPIQPEYT